MAVSYYPGCALHGTSAEYDVSIRIVARVLGLELAELADWNCCGASSAHATDHDLSVQLGVRNLLIAKEAGRDVLVPCAACFQRLKAAEKELQKDAAKWIGKPFESEIRIRHIHELFSSKEMLDTFKRKVTKPLREMSIVTYYGCLSVRPPKITDAENHEDPQGLDKLAKACGAKVLQWSYKTDCCGGSLIMTSPDVSKKLIGDLLNAALEAGADAIVVDCPMCQSNLDTRQEEINRETGKGYRVPVLFITELMALAMGKYEVSSVWKKHFIDPSGLLMNKGLS